MYFHAYACWVYFLVMSRLMTCFRENCYDNFKLTKCKILEETYEREDTALVKFIAHMIQVDLNEKTSFAETSTFERISDPHSPGPWLYKSGIVQASPESSSPVG
jgi:uncharacterized protein YchJ